MMMVDIICCDELLHKKILCIVQCRLELSRCCSTKSSLHQPEIAAYILIDIQSNFTLVK